MRRFYHIYMIFKDGEKFKVWEDAIHPSLFEKHLGKIKEMKEEGEKLIIKTFDGEKEGYFFEAVPRLIFSPSFGGSFQGFQRVGLKSRPKTLGGVKMIWFPKQEILKRRLGKIEKEWPAIKPARCSKSENEEGCKERYKREERLYQYWSGEKEPPDPV